MSANVRAFPGPGADECLDAALGVAHPPHDWPDAGWVPPPRCPGWAPEGEGRVRVVCPVTGDVHFLPAAWAAAVLASGAG